MTHCIKCGYFFPKPDFCVGCENKKKNPPHDCSKDGHVPQQGLITMFKCTKCDYLGELAPELIPSEIELAVSNGYTSEAEETL